MAAVGLVGRNFTNWVKGRISEYGFVESEDFERFDGLSAPDVARSKSRAQKTTEYQNSLDMAKELAMIENNPIGLEMRRYFIEQEQNLRRLIRATPEALAAVHNLETQEAVIDLWQDERRF